ncbi:hypothetical protein PINS_up018099 [Pythium insidiosum]|nr:hypothetical protein PINS_up018099 [Pythium insidiosum]
MALGAATKAGLGTAIIAETTDPTDDDNDNDAPSDGEELSATSVAVGFELASPSTIDTAAPNACSAGGSVKKDDLAALWTFEGHTLRQLQRGDAAKRRRLDDSNNDSNSNSNDDKRVAVDEDGFPLLYGSCGREKRYARCSVCYFRGARCNTAHYCACCQRPVCVRPRTYPGDTQPKICWNVLHMDADMVQRVEKRRSRRTTAATTTGTSSSAHSSPAAHATATAAATTGLVVRLPLPKRTRTSALPSTESVAISPGDSIAAHKK